MAQPLAPNYFDEQAGVATRTQLLEEGLSWGFVRSQVEARRWRELNEHVIVNHNGPLTYEQQLWAVYLSAPQPAAMGGVTGMAQWGVTGVETSRVHILVRRGARVLGVPGIDVVVHESRRFAASDI
jgi:hypothetical protein